jgi:hypothetical protein
MVIYVLVGFIVQQVANLLKDSASMFISLLLIILCSTIIASSVTTRCERSIETRLRIYHLYQAAVYCKNKESLVSWTCKVRCERVPDTIFHKLFRSRTYDLDGYTAYSPKLNEILVVFQGMFYFFDNKAQSGSR